MLIRLIVNRIILLLIRLIVVHRYTYIPARVPGAAAAVAPQRLLRVCTVVGSASKQPLEIYRAADINNISYLLTQKVMIIIMSNTLWCACAYVCMCVRVHSGEQAAVGDLSRCGY